MRRWRSSKAPGPFLFPSLNVGTNFHGHSGNLQRSSGKILNLDQESLYFGGGAGAVGTRTIQVPAVSIISPLTDAIFEPLAAHQQVDRAGFNAAATANRILLEVAELHFELLAAEADLDVRRKSATQETEVARLTRAYADAKQGREADAERAATELNLIVDEIRQAEEGAAVAAARLAQRLHLDQSVRLRPIAPAVETVTIVDPAVAVPDLIQAALQGRPELRAQNAALAAAEIRHQQERYRPILPTLWLGYSAGAFGGGSNLTTPELAHFAGRSDFDVMVFWTLQNFGLGNLALQKQRLAEAGQAAGERSRIIAEIRSEVSAAHASVEAARQQIEITTRELASAEAGFREDLERIRNTVGRPIEVVNSLQLLNQARVARIRAVVDYNKAEFRLFVQSRIAAAARESAAYSPEFGSGGVPSTSSARRAEAWCRHSRPGFPAPSDGHRGRPRFLSDYLEQIQAFPQTAHRSTSRTPNHRPPARFLRFSRLTNARCSP